MATSCSTRPNQDAVQRVESAIENGLRGICFFPAMHRYAMHDDCAVAVLDIDQRSAGNRCFRTLRRAECRHPGQTWLAITI